MSSADAIPQGGPAGGDDPTRGRQDDENARVREVLRKIEASLVESNAVDVDDGADFDFDDCWEAPGGPNAAAGIEYLDFSDWARLRDIPEEVFDLTMLQALHLAKCRSLSRISPRVRRLERLTELDLSRCTSLRSLPSEVCSSLPSLQRLSLAHCAGLESLPDAWIGTSNLTRLDLDGCVRLGSIPRGLWVGAANLVYLGLGRLPCVGPVLSPGVGNLAALRTLNLRGCPNLRRLCAPAAAESTVGRLVGLHGLLAGGTPLRSLPIDALARLRRLQVVDLEGCPDVPALLKDRSRNTVRLIQLLVFTRTRAALLEMAAWKTWAWSEDVTERASLRQRCEGIDIVIRGVLPFLCGEEVPQVFPFCYNQ